MTNVNRLTEWLNWQKNTCWPFGHNPPPLKKIASTSVSWSVNFTIFKKTLDIITMQLVYLSLLWKHRKYQFFFIYPRTYFQYYYLLGLSLICLAIYEIDQPKYISVVSQYKPNKSFVFPRTIKVGRRFKILHPLCRIFHITVVKHKCKVICSNIQVIM